MTQIVLLSGKQGSGKTTLQKELRKRVSHRDGYYAHEINFADPLYKMHNFCVGVLEEAGIKRDLKKDGPLLQLLGTEWGRKTVDENIWVKLLKAEMVARLARQEFANVAKTVFIVGDCRFKNEFDGLPEALRVRLECVKEVRQTRCEMWRPNDKHASEIDLDDHVINHKFDMVFDTEFESIEQCATLILAQLDKNNWPEKRAK